MPEQIDKSFRSEGLRDFISHRPGWLIRWGVLLFFSILVGLVAGSWFIQYPDIVQATARINSINPPKAVITKNSGRLVKLFKADDTEIQQDEIIGYIESTASHEEVLKLSAVLDIVKNLTDSDRIEEIPAFWKATDRSFAHLGELQASHQAFMQAYLTFLEYLDSGFYVAKKQMLKHDLENVKRMLQTLDQQKDLQQQDLALAVQNYNLHDTLHNETLINDIEYRSQKSQLINKKMSIPQITASIISNQRQQNELQKQIMDLDNQVEQQRALFTQSLNTYINIIKDWKQKFLLTAPIKGRLVYATFLEENQQLQANQVIGFITNESSHYYVEMLIPQTNFGKIKPGQEVLLKFPSYPSQEFGSVKGRIEHIKNIPVDSGYLAKVSLPNGLVTNNKKTIFFNEGLMARAEIITANRKLFDRFFSGLKNLIQ